MRTIVFLLCLCMGFLLTTKIYAQKLTVSEMWPPQALTASIYKEFQSFDAAGDRAQITEKVRALLDTPDNPPSVADLRAAVKFFTERTFAISDPKDLYLPYFLLYAETYFALARQSEEGSSFQMVYLKNALAGLMAFEALAMTDSARCFDPSGWKAYKSQLLAPELQKMAVAYSAFSTVEYRQLMESSLEYEQRMVGRRENKEICGKNAPPGAKPEDIYVDAYAWTNARQSTYETLRQFWAKRYEGATNLKLN